MKSMYRKKLGIFVAILMAFVLGMPTGYAGATEGTALSVANLQAAQAAKAKLSATKATVVIGSTLTLTVKSLDDSKVSAIKWKSNRTSIAKVNQKGVVTPIKVGTTTIKCTVTYKDKTTQTLSCTVTVKKRVKATGITIKDTEKAVSLTVGERLTLKPNLFPENTTDMVYWYSSNKSVATVGLTSGKVTAKKEGTVVITAKVGLDKKGATAKTNKVIAKILIEVKSKDDTQKDVDKIEYQEDNDESFFTWKKQNDNITIMGYKEGLPENVVIPEKINKVTVAEIGYAAFENCNSLNSITIPENVKKIGGCAFSGCRELTSITIPNSVTSIGGSAFSYCSGLTSITIPNSITSIGYRAFSYCSGLTSITIPNSVISIGWDAFVGCSGLTSITIPNSVIEIGGYAFVSCSGLTSITIPNSVTSIGDRTFSYCSGLTSITIPNSITSIGDYTFSDCSGLTSITIPNSVTSIGEDAFSGCSSLASIMIPDNVTSIGDRAFSGCNNLTIYGQKDSYAQEYAEKNNIPFIEE